MSTPSAAAGNVVENLENAGRLVDQHIKADQSFWELSGQLTITTHQTSNASGNTDRDYPAVQSYWPALESMPFLGEVNCTPLPPELVQAFENMQCNCAVGLMPLIARAWLTIDSTIYIWSYEDGKDLAYFDGLNEVILTAGLLKPKEGVFQEHIEYLLCLTTPVEIVVLGVSFTGSPSDPYSEMHLQPEPLFNLPSDNVNMLSVVGSPEGRIFLAGKDGCLYEVVYQAEEGWFSSKCRKVNHSVSRLSFLVPSFLTFSEDPLLQIVIDGSRHILYTRSQSGTIQVYDLGLDGHSLSRVDSMQQGSMVQRACYAARSMDQSLFKPIVHMAIIPMSDSSTLHLMAVTQAGVRFYFTTTPNGIHGRPSLLAMVHVRLPPGHSPSSTIPKLGSTVHQSFYRRGTLLLSSSMMEDRDQLWIMDPDMFPFQPTVIESVISRPLEGHTWAIAEAIQPGDLEAVASLTPLPPLVVTQHVRPPRRFILLTTQGCYVITRLRPVDQLQSLFETSKGAAGDAVQSFFALHKEVQACAMALILATSPNQQLAFWATEAFFKYGGEPHIVFPGSGGMYPLGGGGGIVTSTPMTPLAQQQYSTPVHGQTPSSLPHPYNSSVVMNTPGSYGNLQGTAGSAGALGRAVVGPEVVLSGKHDGLCRYLARLLRPLWNEQVAVFYKPPGDMQAEQVVSAYTSEELSAFMEQMYSLKCFIDLNSRLLSALSSRPGSSASPANIHQRVLSYMRPEGMVTTSPNQVQTTLLEKYKADAQVYEQNSLHNICSLVTQCCESLSLWKLVCEHELHVVAEGLSQQERQQLVATTFRALIVSSRPLISSVISALLNRYAGDVNMTESLSSRLLEVAPSLYSQDDAIASKARELVTVARTIQNREEQLQRLKESVMYYSKVISRINLPSVCELCRDLKFYSGIVELALCAAGVKDRKNLAIHFYKSGQPQQDVNGQAAYIERQRCYSIVTSTLQQLLVQEQPAKRPSSVPAQPGPPSPMVERQQPSDPHEEFDELLTMCLRSDDELFHVTLYSWMITAPVNLTDRLVQIRTPYIEPFLKHMVASQQQDILMFLNLLWRYYEKNKNYSAAAKILDQLANIQSPNLTLDQRVEYISRAVMCAKSCNLATSGSSIGEFLHELEDKMEVARIQLNIVEAVKSLQHQTSNTRAAVEMLTRELMDISKLYGDFADPFQLSECKLSIIHCAGHYDSILVESLWTEIIDKEVALAKKQSVENQMQGVYTKLIQLGQVYIHSERFFPLEHIISVLEKYSCQQHWRVDFVYSTLHKVGVSLQTLFDIYNRLFKSKLPFWQFIHQPLSIIYSLHCFYRDNPSLIPAYERSAFKAMVLDAISVYLVELHTATPSAAGDLQMKFRQLQTHIQGLYMDRDR